MKSLVVYHSADFDGLFSGAVAYHFLKDSADYVGWDFGDKTIRTDGYEWVYIIDLPPSCVDRDTPNDRIVWIDHHASSISLWADNKFLGYQLDGVAACRLAWNYFRRREIDPRMQPPEIEDFKAREVSEPMALTLAGEYDVWDKTDPDAEAFQFGLYAEEWSYKRLALVFLSAPGIECGMWVKNGQAAMKWQKQFAADVCKNRGYMVELEGLNFWCLASVHARNSMWFPEGSVPDGADALMCYRLEGDGKAKLSLYHKPGREGLDLSTIAVKYGGGGHRGACGFELGLHAMQTMEILQ